ncbi:BMP family ABC transporter substrate-binding protein [Brassicibacter mesophilus]|uniref:BMP family ABC transporter substrate-binding protein n=1 Tax=Brassicibacter mesophilus TaxID=745119 RepID=UPI003D2334DB
MKKRIMVVVLALVMVSTLLIGCNSSEGNTTDSTQGSEYKVALLIPGNLGDKSFFDASKEAITKIESELGVETAMVEMGTDVSKYYATYQDYCEAGYDLILTISTTGDDILKQAAEEYPEQKFINLDTDTTGFSENVLGVTTKSNEMSFLAGVVAAIKAEEAGSDVIGFIGGMDIPGINYFLVGYIEGAQYINPNIKVNTSYVGSFIDSATAKELASIMYNNGVSIIYQAAGASGIGVIEATTELDKLAIGVDADQALALEESNQNQAEHIVTSAVKQIPTYAVDLVRQDMEGKLKFGESIKLGLAENGVGIAKNSYYEKLMSKENIALVEEAEKKVKDGEVTLSDVYTMTTEDFSNIRSSVAP